MSKKDHLSTFELYMPGSGLASLDSPLAPTRSETACHPPETQEFYPAGAYQLLPGAGVVSGDESTPDGFKWVYQDPLEVWANSYRLARGIGPTCHVVRKGQVRTPPASEESNEIYWVYPGTKLVIDPCSYEKGLVLPLDNPLDDKPKGTIFDMQSRSQRDVQLVRAPKSQNRLPNTSSPQPPQQAKKKHIPRSPQVEASTTNIHKAKPKQRVFDFATEAPTIVSAKPPTEPDLRPRYKPKAGDRGSIQLSKKEIASLMPQLEISGAEETKGFWKPDKHILDFWNLVPDRKVQDKNGNPLKPFKSIPVVANGCIFIPYKIKILHVDGYPDGTNIQDFHDIDTFKRGAMITNHICAIPIGGNLHKWIIFPTNGSSSIGAAVPNRLGKYDNKSNNRCTLHPGSLISRSQDPLWCQFDAYSPGLSSIPFHLFHPGSRTRKSISFDHILDPVQACRKYQQHLRDEATHEKAKINESGSLFKWGRR